jgi:hypothetical protein
MGARGEIEVYVRLNDGDDPRVFDDCDPSPSLRNPPFSLWLFRSFHWDFVEKESDEVIKWPRYRW